MSINNNSEHEKPFLNQLEVSNAQGKQYQFDGLTKLQFWGYAVGHFYNDLCAACWFNYLVFFLQQVQGIEWAPEALLSGQVADAIATPFVGTFSDRTNTKCGKRTPWYIFGISLVTVTFIPTFHNNLFKEWWPDVNENPDDYKGLLVFYYIFFPSMFNIGWAFVQVSNMALVPSLTVSRKRRDMLNSRRNTFTFVANLLVLSLALLFFTLIDEKPVICFELIGYVCTITGLATSTLYLISINEKKLSDECKQCEINLKQVLAQQQREYQISQRVHQESMQGDALSQLVKDISKKPLGPNAHLMPNVVGETDQEFEESEEGGIRYSYRHSLNHDENRQKVISQSVDDWRHWFQNTKFYQFGVVYMGVRLYCNVLATLINFYMVNVLQIVTEEELAKQIPVEVALIPLLLFLSSVAASTQLDKIYQTFGRKQTFTYGTFLGLVSCGTLAFITPQTSWVMYVVAPVIGASQSITLNTGIALISDVIGLKGDGGAFVYGCYSFLDQMMSGIVLYLITSSKYFIGDKNSSVIPKSTTQFTRWITVLVPGISLFGCWCFVMKAKITEYSGQNKEQHSPIKGRISLVEEFAS